MKIGFYVERHLYIIIDRVNNIIENTSSLDMYFQGKKERMWFGLIVIMIDSSDFNSPFWVFIFKTNIKSSYIFYLKQQYLLFCIFRKKKKSPWWLQEKKIV